MVRLEFFVFQSKKQKRLGSLSVISVMKAKMTKIPELPEGTKYEVMELTPDEIKEKAKKEGATVYENTFDHHFEPWPREKVKRNMAKLSQGKEEDGDEELKEFIKYHPVLTKIARGGGEDAMKGLTQLFAAHSDIVSGKTTKDKAVKVLLEAAIRNAAKAADEDAEAKKAESASSKVSN